MTRPSEDISLYGETADLFREAKEDIEDVRGHGVKNPRVIEDLLLLYRQKGLPYEDGQKRS